MIRTLLIIAGAALVLAVAAMGGAMALGGRDLARHGWAWTFRDEDGSSVSFRRADDGRLAETTRTLAWTGGDSLIVDLAADVEYVQGATPGVVITGAPALVERIRLEGNRLSMTGMEGPQQERVVYGRRADGTGIWVGSDEVRVVVTAPSIKTFDLRGSSDVELKGYDQYSLTIRQAGSGDISATGRARSLRLDLSGSGDADLESLSVVDAVIDATGSGDAAIAPTGAATLTLRGSGDVDLTTRPASLRQDISGSGSVTQR